MSAALFNLDNDGTLEILMSRENIKKVTRVTVTQPGRKAAKTFVPEKEVKWHSVDELPPLHEECFDDEGNVCRYEISDWMLVKTGSAGDVYECPVDVAHYVRSGAVAQWENGGGLCRGITHWMPLPSTGF